MKGVTPRTRIFSRSAAQVCPNSCKSADPKKSALVSAPNNQQVASDRSGYSPGKYPSANDHVTKPKIKNQLQRNPTSIPHTRPSLTLDSIVNSPSLFDSPEKVSTLFR